MKLSFDKVYEIVALIPMGKVATYGQIAALLGHPRSARVIGWAMQAAPDHLNLPCHRVVNKAGILAPHYAFGSPLVQRAILEDEGITFLKNGRIDMKKHLWQPTIS
ncbi:methylated-DNA-protein-cysteine methyltransferase-like protein [Anaerosolibacter carboniphilus]|uniref:Methylated-DNA-protein-cysteine methyltransferase-like protein n=1 Tax=Anaerosolibacter carboniphilus TaxID=1417629 RepID=A0A841KZ73_9FIRM|nr:methylated-DNA--[protein]-cysteine S-methyltransferase [Anaerosolibacter carboniphilus]MBB6218924.1 methylated-DNA-protein-cysteine methyltransferase-like protein [Anaerosolibacter carboniphilus]